MKVLLDEPRVFVSYASASVVSGDDIVGENPDFDAAWADESNGLCGAGVPGRLELVLGTHTGGVPFRIELHDSEPALDRIWEEVVEVSFTASVSDAHLYGLMGDDFSFMLPASDYRVRYCIRGFDDAKHSDAAEDTYLLQFWPGPILPGRIVKQTGAEAAYRHRTRRALTPQEQREDEIRAAADLEKQVRERWGDRVPNQRLRRTHETGAGLFGPFLSRLDVDLEFALAEADDSVHRQVAAWAALRCLEESGLINLPSIAPAVAALRRGKPAPPPFDDPAHCWKVLERAGVPRTSVPVPRTSVPLPPDAADEESPQDYAISTLFHSAEQDSLVAVLEIVVCLAMVFGNDRYRDELAQLREHFPDL